MAFEVSFDRSATGLVGRRAAPASLLGRWIRVAEERRALAQAAPETLCDIGLDAADARAEAERPFWDLPVGRR